MRLYCKTIINSVLLLCLVFSLQAEENKQLQCAEPTPRDELVKSLMVYYGEGPGREDIVDPDVKIEDEKDMGDHIRQTISYFVEKDERVRAYLLFPETFDRSKEKLPLILCPHPTNLVGKDCVVNNYPEPAKDEQDVYFRQCRQYALDLVRRGFICFAPDRAAYGERRILKGDKKYTEQIDAYKSRLKERWPDWGFTTGKAVWDLQRALDFLVEYDFVDTDRVAIIGHSLGAWDSMLLSCVDDRIKVAAANAGGTIHFDASLWTDLEQRKELLDKPIGLNRMANLMLMAIAPRPFLQLRAINDSYEKGQPNLLEGYRLLVDYYRMAAGQTRRTWHAPVGIYFHCNEHGFDHDARELAYGWLEMHLK
ncbi:putative dienelactone hydrolase [Limihaloglobus sulfuriphilus]|uniref:Putative dienelactone hydrolase n=1 Tax=Limihaloglobus sulfuriphilus TaxID=1851148 RepID=A0A1Q2MCA8_9BACT|nr:putative dienelactone hydrolase [Limihaloglobus sulfuriphilus]